jgi:hypothetical protein
VGVLDWLNPVSKALDIVDQSVTDKDKREAIRAELEKVAQQVYMRELGTKTIPWVDAVHKMGRQIIAVLNLAAVTYLASRGVDIDPAMIAGLSGPSAVYAWVKGKGR